MIVDRIRELCEKRGTNFSAVEKALGLANASLKKTNEKTQASRLKAIADYFGVSVEYLLTGKETINRAATVQEQELLRLFRSLTSDGRAEAIKRIREMTMVDAWTREIKKPELSIS